MIIYPAIDIRNGRAVRLLQGKAEQETVYFDQPLEAAKFWLQAGTRWLHMVDLDGAFTGNSKNLAHVERVAALGIKVQLGGGLRNFQAVRAAFDAGVTRVVVGTRACSDPDFVKRLVKAFGDRVAVGIDAKDGKVAVKGWVDTSDVSALDLAKQVSDLGVRTIIYTDISTDGMMTGPNLAAQEEMLNHCSANIVASGGVSKMEDLHKLADLAERYDNLDGVITGKALYEGTIDLKEALARFPQ
ncbi:MAG: 1-(5-phosphoribosyl)-5-[(5-phosphoribosylamino)methylideneamino]imidazole-4-carboxamide isomerase [Verrucomicrobiae bacterium]|nr:1-(5-phosphoribosyl)-5-[(5-phosphoribosylamino)methylideneamino]imidazole-4-carboxamide isomerase [Verrucomicrobiae bacterium]